MTDDNPVQLAINTIRTLSMDAVQQAQSGHPGTPMALAPLIYTLWNRVLQFDPQDPAWPNRSIASMKQNALKSPASRSSDVVQTETARPGPAYSKPRPIGKQQPREIQLPGRPPMDSNSAGYPHWGLNE